MATKICSQLVHYTEEHATGGPSSKKTDILHSSTSLNLYQEMKGSPKGTEDAMCAQKDHGQLQETNTMQYSECDVCLCPHVLQTSGFPQKFQN